jgi:hypothetical protein
MLIWECVNQLQRTAGGFTFMASLGLGYAPGVPEGESEVGGIGGLGFGYTWRR